MQNRLREARNEAGISQEKLSKETGLSRTTLSKIENNVFVNVNTATISKLSRALNKKPEEIFLF